MRVTKKYAGGLLLGALVLAQAPASHAQSAEYLEQGWTSSDRSYFYTTTQGSRLMSYRVFVKLERAGSTERFASQSNLSAMGYLFDSAAANNPDGLPIGFVKDTSQWFRPNAIGLTCAACHTRDVVVKSSSGASQRFRIDGGQSYADTERFLRELEAALQATASEPTKLARLYTALGASTSSARQSVLNELQAALSKLTEESLANAPYGVRSLNNPGPGRLDALGHIKNRVANTVYPNNYMFAGNNVDATAPVSFPFLWDAPYLDFVQYPGNVANANLGSLARNAGEVTGVFAETSVSRDLGVFDADSTADIPRLVELENKVLKLKSPLWPSSLAPVNQALAAQGDWLFQEHCASCHVEVDRAPRTTWIPTFAFGADVVGTDSKQADNNVDDRAYAGLSSANPSTLVNPMGILGSIVTSLLIPELLRAPFLHATHKQSGAPSSPTRILAEGEDPIHTYKARPLNGIWATAPYLHNGSVRTLADLLLPGDQRPTSFCVGSLEIDTVGVGMKGDCNVPNVYLFDATREGNSALGHEYGTVYDERVLRGEVSALTAQERAALVEYMKTL